MDTPSFFSDCVDLDDITAFPVAFNNTEEGGTVDGNHDFQTHNVAGGTAAPRASDWSDCFMSRQEDVNQPAIPRSLLEKNLDPALSNFDPSLLEADQNKPRQSAVPQARPSSSYGTRSSTRTRSSSSSQLRGGSKPATATATPPTPISPKKQMSRKPKLSDISRPPDGDVKRDKFLERNRIAASKCRQKKKEYVLDLEETKSRLETQNTQLQAEYTSLVTEVSEMKNQLMSHSSCRDPRIDRWIESEARKFVQKSAERFGQIPENKTTPTEPGFLPLSTRSDSCHPGVSSGVQNAVAFEAVDTNPPQRLSFAYPHEGDLEDFFGADAAYPVSTSSLQTSPILSELAPPGSVQTSQQLHHEIGLEDVSDMVYPGFSAS